MNYQESIKLLTEALEKLGKVKKEHDNCPPSRRYERSMYPDGEVRFQDAFSSRYEWEFYEQLSSNYQKIEALTTKLQAIAQDASIKPSDPNATKKGG